MSLARRFVERRDATRRAASHCHWSRRVESSCARPSVVVVVIVVVVVVVVVIVVIVVATLRPRRPTLLAPRAWRMRWMFQADTRGSFYLSISYLSCGFSLFSSILCRRKEHEAPGGTWTMRVFATMNSARNRQPDWHEDWRDSATTVARQTDR